METTQLEHQSMKLVYNVATVCRRKCHGHCSFHGDGINSSALRTCTGACTALTDLVIIVEQSSLVQLALARLPWVRSLMTHSDGKHVNEDVEEQKVL